MWTHLKPFSKFQERPVHRLHREVRVRQDLQPEARHDVFVDDCRRVENVDEEVAAVAAERRQGATVKKRKDDISEKRLQMN